MSARCKNGVGQHGDQYHQGRHAEKAEDRRRADVGALLCIARIHACALDSEKDEHRDKHGRANLLEQAGRRHAFAAPEVRAEQICLEREDQDEDEDQDRDDLCDRDDGVDGGGLLDPPQDHEVKEPDPDRGDDDRRDRVAIPEDRKESAERRLDQDPIRNVADATRRSSSRAPTRSRDSRRIRPWRRHRRRHPDRVCVRQAPETREPACTCRHPQCTTRKWRQKAPSRGRRSGAMKRCPSPPSTRPPSRSERTTKAFVVACDAIPRLNNADGEIVVSPPWPGAELDWLQLQWSCSRVTARLQGRFPSLVYCTSRVRPDIG